jgi:hypothetical protein
MLCIIAIKQYNVFEQQGSIMKKPNKRICLISGVSFFAGAWIGCFALKALFLLSQWNTDQREKEIRLFFYKTLHAIFEKTYDSNKGSVYPDVLKTIKEYESRLGKKCEFFINDSSSDYTEGTAFFPSGDFFYVLIDRKGKSWVINQFYRRNWGEGWHDTLHSIGVR